jgi:PTS system galactitol-specific IIA component
MDIVSLLDPSAILLNLEAGSSTEVIERLGGTLNTLGCVRDDFVEATLRREATLPTGLPLGGSINAALPHVDLEYVKKPALALATLRHPVVFYNMVETDKEVPVRLVIMLALDKPKSQVEMLQQIAGILQNPAIVKNLTTAENAEEILSILRNLEAPA